MSQKSLEAFGIAVGLCWLAVALWGGLELMEYLFAVYGNAFGPFLALYVISWVACIYVGRLCIEFTLHALLPATEKGEDAPFLDVGTTEALYPTPHGLLMATTASLMIIGGASSMANVPRIAVITGTSGIPDSSANSNPQNSIWINTTVVRIDSISLPGALIKIEANDDVSN